DAGAECRVQRAARPCGFPGPPSRPEASSTLTGGRLAPWKATVRIVFSARASKMPALRETGRRDDETVEVWDRGAGRRCAAERLRNHLQFRERRPQRLRGRP